MSSKNIVAAATGVILICIGAGIEIYASTHPTFTFNAQWIWFGAVICIVTVAMD